MRAIQIIHDEHRSLAAVLHGMLFLVRQMRYAGADPNFDVLVAMVHYIDVFSERFHHPKEDQYLFRLLRLRHPDAIPLLATLEAEPVYRNTVPGPGDDSFTDDGLPTPFGSGDDLTVGDDFVP